VAASCCRYDAANRVYSVLEQSLKVLLFSLKRFKPSKLLAFFGILMLLLFLRSGILCIKIVDMTRDLSAIYHSSWMHLCCLSTCRNESCDSFNFMPVSLIIQRHSENP